MANTRIPAFLSHNNNKAAASGTTLATTSADASYPAANLKLLPIAKVWRSAAAALTNVDITLDLGSAMSINFIGLINHNFTTAVTVSVAAGATTGYADYAASMTYREFDMWVTTFANPQSYRYWRIRITDAANTDNFIEVGYVMLGSATQLASSFQYGWEQVDEYENLDVQSEFGVPFVTEMFYRMRFRFTFRNKSSTEVSAIRTIFKDVKGNLTPLLFLPDSTAYDAYFGRFQNNLTRQTDFRITIPALEFLEDSRGKKIT